MKKGPSASSVRGAVIRGPLLFATVLTLGPYICRLWHFANTVDRVGTISYCRGLSVAA